MHFFTLTRKPVVIGQHCAVFISIYCKAWNYKCRGVVMYHDDLLLSFAFSHSARNRRAGYDNRMTCCLIQQVRFAACTLTDIRVFFGLFCLLSQPGSAEGPLRVFNSPYSTISLDYNPVSRMAKVLMFFCRFGYINISEHSRHSKYIFFLWYKNKHTVRSSCTDLKNEGWKKKKKN